MQPPQPSQAPRRILTRRRLLQLSTLSGAGLLLDACGAPLYSRQINKVSEPLNQRVEKVLLRQTPVPEYPISAITPDALLVNSFDGTPQIDMGTFQLTLDGAVNRPMQLSMADIKAMPLTSTVIRHICVEGWSAIVQWGGVRMQDLAALVEPRPEVRYVYFQSADNYYESWDLPSALHSQTLMAYQRDGMPLPAENGAPLRLAAPIKLGYKLSKWVTRISFMADLPEAQGYWEDKGYEWFGGI